MDASGSNDTASAGTTDLVVFFRLISPHKPILRLIVQGLPHHPVFLDSYLFVAKDVGM